MKVKMTLRSLLSIRQVPYLNPDQSLDVAMRYVYRHPVLPVVSRADVTKLGGVISKEDVLKRYQDLGEDIKEHY
jgi:CBS domain-containing protein